ncbi:uncharacterized protein LOC132612123 [Lycium barbarum]|uniref:uncharacterized protein LOC132612123 n=1 Tax=Lycium barbarum TaxID=112863 RepID=UPI00293E3981|nr:uncharacterized protein LOC132612123 [Lycium barbarum]
MEDQVLRFVIGRDPHLIHDCMTASLQEDMDISRIQELESSPDVVIGILSISSHEVYALIDPGSSLSSATLFIASKYGIESEKIRPFEVSTPISDSQGLPWSPRTTVANLIELDVVDFDVIIGIDWVREKDIPKAAFWTRYGHLEFLVMSFGLPNVIAVFLDLINIMIRLFIDLFMIVLIDDILVYSQSEAEHANHLRAMLRVLQDKKLYVMLSKYEFWLNSVAFLGHIVSGEGIMVDTQKIEAVRTWPRPMTPTEFVLLAAEKRELAYKLHQLASLGIQLLDFGNAGVTVPDTTTSSLVVQVKEHWYEDPSLIQYGETAPQKKKSPFEISGDGV